MKLEIDAKLSLVNFRVIKAEKAAEEITKNHSDECFIYDEISQLKRLAEKYPELATLISEDTGGETMSTVRIVRYVNVYPDGGLGALHDTRKKAEMNVEDKSARVAKLVEVFDELEKESHDDKVIDDSIDVAIDEAVDNLKEPSEVRKPLHFFSPVRIESNRISSSSYNSYNNCHAATNNDAYRVAEFREVMPEPEGDYYWVNLYVSTEDDEGSVYGFLNDSEQKAIENRSDSLEFVACVKIKGKR